MLIDDFIIFVQPLKEAKPFNSRAREALLDSFYSDLATIEETSKNSGNDTALIGPAPQPPQKEEKNETLSAASSSSQWGNNEEKVIKKKKKVGLFQITLFIVKVVSYKVF